MSGVWIFDKKGVARLVQNPTRESFEQKKQPSSCASSSTPTATAPGARPRILVYTPTNQVIRSLDELEHRLVELGWKRYQNPYGSSSGLIQFHRSDDSVHLISLPSSFADFRPFHMYDVVVKNRSFFEVRDPLAPSSTLSPSSIGGELVGSNYSC